MRTTDFQRLQNIAETTIAVKKEFNIQEQPVAPNRTANSTGNEVVVGDTIYSLEDGKIEQYSMIYQDTVIID